MIKGKKYADIMSVGVVNFKTASADFEQNLSRITGYAEKAARMGVDLVLFPEMCLTGYDWFTDPAVPLSDKKSLARSSAQSSLPEIEAISKKYGIYIVWGAPEYDEKNDLLYNSAFVSGPEGLIGTYRKIHPFGAENTWCAKGTDPFMIQTKFGPIGIGICYDSYQFPELVRYYTEKGCRLYLNPTAELEEINKSHSRKAFYSYYDLLEYAVKCNTIFLASANLTGWDKDSYFAGGSYIIGPKITPFFETEVFCYGGSKENTQEKLSIAVIDLSLATRRLCTSNDETGTPDFRPELYRTWK